MGNAPRLRFEGFTGDWEHCKIGELIEDYVEKTTIQNQYPVLTSSQQNGIILQKDYFSNRQITTDSNIGYYVLPYGYFTYRSRSDTNVFVFNRNDIISKGIISYYYPVFKERYVDAEFLLRRLNHGTKRQISIAVEGTGQKVLAYSKFKNITVNVPESIGEQHQIGFLFSSVDRLIILYQRKLDALTKAKQFYLQTMFPQKGERKPRLRFAGYTGDWEPRKFSEIAQRQAETAVSDDYYPCLEYEDVVAGQGVLNKDIYAKRVEKTGIKFSPLDVLYGKLRPYLHNWLNPNFSGVAVGDWWVLRPINSNKDFLYRLIQTSQFDIAANLTTGTKMPRADWKTISHLDFLLPNSLREQAEIAGMFDTLDNIIILQQRKITALQTMKQFFLQNMFV